MEQPVEVFIQQPGETCGQLFRRIADYFDRFPTSYCPVIIHIDHTPPHRLVVIII